VERPKLPRKSAEELGLAVIDIQAQRLKPPAYLKKEERVIFEHVVNHSAPMHFKENESTAGPLLHLDSPREVLRRQHRQRRRYRAQSQTVGRECEAVCELSD
jgi:hypothetical protein